MLSLEQQEAYRRRYAQARPGWRPSTHVYQDLVAERLNPTTRTLDLGCGRGGVMERLHAHAGLVAGLDPDSRSLEDHRASSLVLTCGLAEALPFADASFEVVCCSWVLEHLADPAAVFREVARVLRKGGSFIFITPNSLHPLVALNRVLQRVRAHDAFRLYGRAEVDAFPVFYRANTAPRIRRLSDAAGLECKPVRLIGDPTYLAFSEPLFRLGCLLERLTPPAMRTHLVGECTVS